MPRYKFILEEYKQEYGRRKYRKIKSHISNSEKAKSLIRNSLKHNSYPSGDDIIVTVFSHLRYGFAPADTVLVASLVILKLLVRAKQDAYMPLKEYQIKQIEEEIISEYDEIVWL